MDAGRFDDLLRSLTSAPSRRDFARMVIGIAFGAAGFATVAETEAKKPCPPCRVRRKGKCKAEQPDGTSCGACKVCKSGECRPVRDGASCDGGNKCKACKNGSCRPIQDGTSCDTNNACKACRNGSCRPRANGAVCGEPCDQCQDGSCIVAMDGASCGVCKQCNEGACQTSPDNTECGDVCLRCQGGECQARTDGAVCGSDPDNRCVQCQAGECTTLSNGAGCGPGRTCQGGVCPICPPVTGGSGKAVGDACNADTPEECASGVCGCSFTTCPCFCREPNCAETGGNCEARGTLGCCKGLCQNRDQESDVCVA